MNRKSAVSFLAGVVVCGLVVGVFAQNKPKEQEQERSVKESEVPAAALAALKKHAGGAPLTEFSEEIEHGHKFYEGSWKGPDGNVDCLVTATGDLVELEEKLPAAKVPAAVRAAAEKEAGKDAKVSFEKKTEVMYEIHFRKGDRGHEIMFYPTGDRAHGEGHDEDEKEQDKDED